MIMIIYLYKSFFIISFCMQLGFIFWEMNEYFEILVKFILEQKLFNHQFLCTSFSSKNVPGMQYVTSVTSRVKTKTWFEVHQNLEYKLKSIVMIDQLSFSTFIEFFMTYIWIHICIYLRSNVFTKTRKTS